VLVGPSKQYWRYTVEKVPHPKYPFADTIIPKSVSLYQAFLGWELQNEANFPRQAFLLARYRFPPDP
jgi:hypothetical protein